MTPSKKYDSPRVTEYGSIESVTQQLNKDGLDHDQYTDDTGGIVVGTISSAP